MLSRLKPVVLLILDGFGYTLDTEYNAIPGGKYDVIICNYANCDMMGHTGIIDAGILAVEVVDASLRRVVDALKSVGGQMLITADHGNIEQMVDKETGQPHTAKTTNPAPLVYVGGDKPLLDADGSLSDLAPTVLAMLGVEQPVEMTGRSVIKLV
jgi:2,3-bisphosphoglycerate-independent phosphoglycerate mutase